MLIVLRNQGALWLSGLARQIDSEAATTDRQVGIVPVAPFHVILMQSILHILCRVDESESSRQSHKVVDSERRLDVASAYDAAKNGRSIQDSTLETIAHLFTLIANHIV
jgi:hypothetical protein